MKIRNLTVAAIAAVAVGTMGCELTGKYDTRLSTWNWLQVEADDCVAIGSYVMGINLTTPPARAKAQIKIKPEFKEDRDFLPTRLELRYSLTRGLSTTPLAPPISFDLKNGKGKYQFPLGSQTFLQDDEIGVELCNTGDEGSFVPSFSEIDYRFQLKFDKVDNLTW